MASGQRCCIQNSFFRQHFDERKEKSEKNQFTENCQFTEIFFLNFKSFHACVYNRLLITKRRPLNTKTWAGTNLFQFNIGVATWNYQYIAMVIKELNLKFSLDFPNYYYDKLKSYEDVVKKRNKKIEKKQKKKKIEKRNKRKCMEKVNPKQGEYQSSRKRFKNQQN